MARPRRTDSPPANDWAQEALLVAAGGRAILLQVADPAIAAAVARHSDFAHRITDRLRHTLTYCYAVVGGSEQDAALVRRHVNAAHAPVRSGTGDPVAFNAFDPDLQLWVAATLYDAAVVVHHLVWGALSRPQADLVLAQFAPLATALQVPAERWPGDRAAFDAYWARRRGELVVGDDARQVCADLLHPAGAPLWLRPMMPVARLVTAGLLDPALRQQYGLAWDDRRQRRFDHVLALVRAVYPRLPRRWRRWPRTVLLRRLRRDAAAQASPGTSRTTARHSERTDRNQLG
jgi:uncharacterized protein (DUF2236 family)